MSPEENPHKKPPRKSPTQKQRMELLEETRFVCPNPGCQTPKVKRLSFRQFEIHHISGRDNRESSNLIALCKNCHKLADDHIITETDLIWWKKALVNRVHPRLGNETAADLVKPAKMATKKKFIFNAATDNGTINQAERIINNYRTAKKPSVAPAPDSIAAHAAERSYMVHLREAYIKCRMKEKEYGDAHSLSFHPAQANNSIKRALGIDPMTAPLENFDQVQQRFYELVCKTLGARKYMRGYKPHTWDEHQRRLAEGEK